MASLPLQSRIRNVDTIKTNILRPALTSHFEVEIPYKKLLENRIVTNVTGLQLNSNDEYKLRLSCCEASLPGSSLATLEINNDYTGVTERHAHRRIYDDRIDFTFYVDAQKYLPIVFFESWIKYIAGESVEIDEDMRGASSKDRNYFYRVRYPNSYIMDNGLKIIKFERDYLSNLEYEFIGAYPISISSMPVSYDTSSLLKCTVSITYIRYVINKVSTVYPADPQPVTKLNTPQQQASLNGYNFQNNPMFANPKFASGGVPDFAAKSSGNTVMDLNRPTLAQINE